MKSFLFPVEYELFNLEKDPYEWTNLAKSEKHRSKIKELLTAMKDFQKKIKDPFLHRKNLDLFQAEQMRHRTINYRKINGFRWPHLDLFKKANQ